MLYTPGVIWKDETGRDSLVDLATRLLKDRIIILQGEINDEMAMPIIAQLRYLESEDKDKPITMLIQSPGGSVSAGFSIISTMNLIKPKVSTIVQGSVASMATVIAASGEKGMRYALPNTEIMLHTVASGMQGKVQDMQISFEQTNRMNEKIFEHLSKCLDKPVAMLKKDCDRDFWMDEKQWKKYGGCDKIKEAK